MRILLTAALSMVLCASAAVTTNPAVTPPWVNPIYSHTGAINTNDEYFSSGVYPVPPQAATTQNGGGDNAAVVTQPVTWHAWESYRHAAGSPDGRSRGALCQRGMHSCSYNGLQNSVIGGPNDVSNDMALFKTTYPVSWFGKFVSSDDLSYWVYTTPFTVGAHEIGSGSLSFNVSTEAQSNGATTPIPKNYDYWFNYYQVSPFVSKDGVVVMQAKANDAGQITAMRMVKYFLEKNPDSKNSHSRLELKATTIIWNYDFTATGNTSVPASATPLSVDPEVSMWGSEDTESAATYVVVKIGATSFASVNATGKGHSPAQTNAVCTVNWSGSVSNATVYVVGALDNRVVAWQETDDGQHVLSYLDNFHLQCTTGSAPIIVKAGGRVGVTRSFNMSGSNVATDQTIKSFLINKGQAAFCFKSSLASQSLCCATQQLSQSATVFSEAACATAAEDATFLAAAIQTNTSDSLVKPNVLVLQTGANELLGYHVNANHNAGTSFAWRTQSVWGLTPQSTIPAGQTPRANLQVNVAHGQLFLAAGEKVGNVTWAPAFNGVNLHNNEFFVGVNVSSGKYSSLGASDGFNTVVPVPNADIGVTDGVALFTVSATNLANTWSFRSGSASGDTVGSPVFYPFNSLKKIYQSASHLYYLSENGTYGGQATPNTVMSVDAETQSMKWNVEPTQLPGEKNFCPSEIVAESANYLMGVVRTGKFGNYGKLARVWIFNKLSGKNVVVRVHAEVLSAGSSSICPFGNPTLSRYTVDAANDAFFVSNGAFCVLRLEVSTDASLGSPTIASTGMSNADLGTDGFYEGGTFQFLEGNLYYQTVDVPLTSQTATSKASFEDTSSGRVQADIFDLAAGTARGEVTKVNGNVYQASERELTCYDATTLVIKWSAPLPDSNTASTSIDRELTAYWYQRKPISYNGYIIQLTHTWSTGNQAYSIKFNKFYQNYEPHGGSSSTSGPGSVNGVIVYTPYTHWSTSQTFLSLPPLHFFDFGKAVYVESSSSSMLNVFDLGMMTSPSPTQLVNYDCLTPDLGNDQGVPQSKRNLPHTAATVWLKCSTTVNSQGFEAPETLKALEISYKGSTVHTVDLGLYSPTPTNPSYYSVFPGHSIAHSPKSQVLEFFKCPNSTIIDAPTQKATGIAARTGTAPAKPADWSGSGSSSSGSWGGFNSNISVSLSWAGILGIVMGGMFCCAIFVLVLLRVFVCPRQQQQLVYQQQGVPLNAGAPNLNNGGYNAIPQPGGSPPGGVYGQVPTMGAPVGYAPVPEQKIV